MHTLYAKDSKGDLRQWSIWADGDYIMIEYGKVGGELITNCEPVKFGLAGRTKEEQIIMRIKSRISKKLDAGYTASKEHAEKEKRTNQLGLLRPMSAQRLNHIEETPDGPLYVQHKLNGHRCMITNEGGENIAYSKGGKLIETIPEILKEIKIPEGITIDGELYDHGSALQTISSWVRRRQLKTLRLNFHCFDVIMDEPFSERHKFLKTEIKFGDKSRYIQTTYYNKTTKEFLPLLLRRSLEDGYEGLMLRLPHGLYESNKRSKNILKVKRKVSRGFIMDDEFLVVNIKTSVDGWARLVCETESGAQFMVSAPGSIEEKTEILLNKNEYIGKHVRCEFEGFTKALKPVECVAIGWREKHEE